MAELSLKVFPHGIPQVRDPLPLQVAEADRYIVDAATRLLELMARPSDAALLAPLAVDEILIRVLSSPPRKPARARRAGRVEHRPGVKLAKDPKLRRQIVTILLRLTLIVSRDDM